MRFSNNATIYSVSRDSLSANETLELIVTLISEQGGSPQLKNDIHTKLLSVLQELNVYTVTLRNISRFGKIYNSQLKYYERKIFLAFL